MSTSVTSRGVNLAGSLSPGLGIGRIRSVAPLKVSRRNSVPSPSSGSSRSSLPISSSVGLNFGRFFFGCSTCTFSGGGPSSSCIVSLPFGPADHHLPASLAVAFAQTLRRCLPHLRCIIVGPDRQPPDPPEQREPLHGAGAAQRPHRPTAPLAHRQRRLDALGDMQLAGDLMRWVEHHRRATHRAEHRLVLMPTPTNA